MHPLLRLGYGAAGQLARALSAIAPDGETKLRRALRGRRGIRARYARWGREGREPARPLLWMHAPSVGEGLQARPVLQLARERRPDVQLAYTYFSPSAAPFARALNVDFADYLPFDTKGDAAAALDALRPRALVFSKLDVWPMLAATAHARGVRLGLVSATLAEGSSRRRPVAARVLREAYGLLDTVGAIDESDAERLVALGVARERIHVTGDTRFDQVWARAQAARARADGGGFASDRPTLVAGSTWPADEAPLLEAWLDVVARVPRARLIIAPHEPTAAHLEPIVAWASRHGMRLARLSAADAAAADVVLVDRVGVLGDLYAVARVAFVGGGFHDAGLHSVLEPAAFGAPVLVGPRHHRSREAGLLIDAGGGVVVHDAPEIASRLTGWLVDDADHARASKAAVTLVQRGLGAAERSWTLVAGLLGP